MVRTYSRRSVLAGVAAGSTASVAGCLGLGDDGETIRVSGGVGPRAMVEVWGDIYEEDNDVQLDISGGGTGVGVSDVLNDQVDIAMMGREPFEEERDQGLVAVPMLIDTVVGTVSADNPVLDEIQQQGLTRADMEAAFTREVTNWGELLGTDIDEDIVVFGRSDASAAYKQWGDFLAGEDGAYTQSELEAFADESNNGDSGVVQALRRTENGIGMNNINFVYDTETGELDGDIRPIPLDRDGTGLDPAEDFYETRDEILGGVERGDYPAPPAREMWLAANDTYDETAAEFVEWVLDEGQQHVRENGYVPLDEDRLVDGRETLSANSEL